MLCLIIFSILSSVNVVLPWIIINRNAWLSKYEWMNILFTSVYSQEVGLSKYDTLINNVQ